MAFTQTAKQVTATINKVDGKTLRAAIQAACVNVIGHAMQFGHSPLANVLDDRMALSPMMKRHQPVVQKFLTGYGPFNYSKDTGFVFSKAKRATLTGEGYEFEDFEASCPMWDDVTKADKKAADLDVFKEVEKLIVRAGKKEAEGHCIDAGMIEYLKALCGQYAGRKALAAAAASSKAAEPAKVEEGAKVEGETTTA